MKKPYQIEAQRAVKQFEAMAADGNPAVQMHPLDPPGMPAWFRTTDCSNQLPSEFIPATAVERGAGASKALDLSRRYTPFDYALLRIAATIKP